MKDARKGTGYELPDALGIVRAVTRQVRLAGGAVVTENGSLTTQGFVPGTDMDGWILYGSGDFEFGGGLFRGDIIADSFATGVPDDRRIVISTGDAGLIEFWQDGQTAEPGFIQATTSTGNPAMEMGTGGGISLLMVEAVGMISLTAPADIFMDASVVTMTASAGVTFNSDSITMQGLLWDEESWHAVSFANSWVDFGGAFQTARYKHTGGQVEVQGVIKDGVIGSAAFTLPVGYRPAATLAFASFDSGVQGWGRVDVLANGNVVPMSGTSGGGYGCNFSFTPG